MKKQYFVKFKMNGEESNYSLPIDAYPGNSAKGTVDNIIHEIAKIYPARSIAVVAVSLID